jgi:hypothetical protein
MTQIVAQFASSAACWGRVVLMWNRIFLTLVDRGVPSAAGEAELVYTFFLAENSIGDLRLCD